MNTPDQRREMYEGQMEINCLERTFLRVSDRMHSDKMMLRQT